MNTTCDSCGAKYTIADKKVQGRRLKIRCKSCGKQIVVEAKGGEADAPLADAEAAAPLAESQPPPAHEANGATPAPASAASGSWEVNLSETDQRTMTTAEIVAGWATGLVTEDAFVWKEGFADWVPIKQVPELAKDAAPPPESKKPSLPPAPAPRVFAEKPVSSPTTAKVVARAAKKPDLFGAVASAGSEEESRRENQAAPGSTQYNERPTGVRNENSVLFSIDSLKAGFVAAPPPRSSPQKPTADPFGMTLGSGGVVGGLALTGNDALLSAPAPEPPRPTLTAIAAPVSTMPGQYGKDDKTKLLVIAGGTIAVLLSVIIVMALGGDDEEDAAKLAQAAPSSKVAGAAPEAAKGDEAPKADTPSPQGSAEAAPAEAAAGNAAATKTASASGGSSTGSTKPATGTSKPGKTPGTKPEEDKVPVKDKPSDGVGTFNRSAAISALSSAANGASGCVRPDGPVGTGQAVVTFAASGKVTTVNVGAPFGGTRVGSCVASLFRRARVPAFSGSAVTVSKRFTVAR